MSSLTLGWEERSYLYQAELLAPKGGPWLLPGNVGIDIHLRLT